MTVQIKSQGIDMAIFYTGASFLNIKSEFVTQFTESDTFTATVDFPYKIFL